MAQAALEPAGALATTHVLSLGHDCHCVHDRHGRPGRPGPHDLVDRRKRGPLIEDESANDDPAGPRAVLNRRRRSPVPTAVRPHVGRWAGDSSRNVHLVRFVRPVHPAAQVQARSDRNSHRFSAEPAHLIHDSPLELRAGASHEPSTARDRYRKCRFGPPLSLRLPLERERVRVGVAPIAPRHQRCVPTAQLHPCSP